MQFAACRLHETLERRAQPVAAVCETRDVRLIHLQQLGDRRLHQRACLPKPAERRLARVDLAQHVTSPTGSNTSKAWLSPAGVSSSIENSLPTPAMPQTSIGSGRTCVRRVARDITFVAFDLLVLDDDNLCDRPSRDRRHTNRSATQDNATFGPGLRRRCGRAAACAALRERRSGPARERNPDRNCS